MLSIILKLKFAKFISFCRIEPQTLLSALQHFKLKLQGFSLLPSNEQDLFPNVIRGVRAVDTQSANKYLQRIPDFKGRFTFRDISDLSSVSVFSKGDSSVCPKCFSNVYLLQHCTNNFPESEITHLCTKF